MKTAIMSVALLLTAGCFKSDREKVSERVTQFIGHFNWQGQQLNVLGVLKRAKQTAEHLAPQFQLKLQVRETHFKQIDDLKQFQQNYGLLRRVCPVLTVAIQGPPRISQQGAGYLVKVALQAQCIDSTHPQGNQDIMYYQFHLEKIDGDWLIAKGENENLFSE